MHISSLEANTTLNTYNLWKLPLRGHLNTDARTKDRTSNSEHFDHKNDAVTDRQQLQINNGVAMDKTFCCQDRY